MLRVCATNVRLFVKAIPLFVKVRHFKTVHRKPSNLKYPFDPYDTKKQQPDHLKDANGNFVDPATTTLSIDEIIASVNTKLDPQQLEYVNKLQKSARGTSKVRSLYRDVPKPEDLSSTGNFISKIAPNAQELIDYALSHVNKRAGPTHSRQKKRMRVRIQQSLHDHQRRISETILSEKRKKEKKLKQIKLMKKYKQFSIQLNYPTPINVEKYETKKLKFKSMREKLKKSAL